MCGRYTNTAAAGELSERLHLPIVSDEGTGRYNVAPTQEVLAVVRSGEDLEERMLRWGLVPFWAKDTKGGARMINARIETVTTKPSFRALVPKASHRALQIADGYFEWIKPEHRGQPRQPFYFQLEEGEPFAFAALWTSATVEGEKVESSTILTCSSESNRLVSAIHNRMPVILADEESRAGWLDPGLGAEEALALCQPLEASRMTVRPVTTAVNRVGPGAEGPAMLAPPDED
ncbi:MAG TPA: SOS response-associated peptidase [Solirubrobacteraceae bacterium]|nr:SOS response-associated peptidase [Solirubrobacteraceae bacterium]